MELLKHWKEIFLFLFSILMVLIFLEASTRILFHEKKYYQDGLFNEINHKEEYNLQDYYVNRTTGLVYYSKNGSLSPEYALFKNDNAGGKIIAIVGDSFTKGAGVEQNESYVRRLSAMLGEGFNVHPYAESGINTFQEYIIIRELVMKIKPDLLILQFATNDVDPVRTPLGWITKEGSDLPIYVYPKSRFLIINKLIVPQFSFLSEGVNRFILKRSAFLRFVSFRLNTIEFKDRESIEEVRDGIISINSLLKSADIPFIAINFPLAIKDYDSCGYKINQVIENLTDSLRIPYYNLCNNINLSEVASTEGHYNRQGNLIAAQVIFNAIKNSSSVD